MSASGEDVGDAGAVNVLYGLVGVGRVQADDQFWNQNSVDINGQIVFEVAEAGDGFGG